MRLRSHPIFMLKCTAESIHRIPYQAIARPGFHLDSQKRGLAFLHSTKYFLFRTRYPVFTPDQHPNAPPIQITKVRSLASSLDMMLVCAPGSGSWIHAATRVRVVATVFSTSVLGSRRPLPHVDLQERDSPLSRVVSYTHD